MAKESIGKQLDSINEYEREPIPPSKLKGWKSFIGMYAGEHTAGTEFVIGPLFVAHGVTAFDLVAGLLIGNLLAVLSWVFLTAPIAVRNRMTLYYQLEKICGPQLVKVYNLVNGLMFCFLAGSMIAVSATAVGIPFDILMPSLSDWLPNSVGWVVVVLAVGLVITVVAILGYEQISHFANIASPWMILVFLAAAIAVMPNMGINSPGDFWTVARESIWTGDPIQGQSKFTIWHVTFFAWFANMAMHIGMADLSIFRYAKKASYGLSSAFGMYLGHYLAWMASGILYAYWLMQFGENSEFAPGKIAYQAAGLAGAVCVVIAGWTTSNPTIYRAGLAFQALNPRWKRWKVTLFTGVITSIVACFPALVMRLLDFVALYGLILMPMGAVIFMDEYVLKKFGMIPRYAERAGIDINWAAAAGWIVTLALCLALNLISGMEIFFLGLPGWFIAALLYLILSRFNRIAQTQPA
jgi:purine-cytosine permease-like protein